MRKSIRDLEPGKWILRKPIWKFDSLVLDEGTLLEEKELQQLEQWDMSRVDVDPLPDPAGQNTTDSNEVRPVLSRLLSSGKPETFVPVAGVTDAVDSDNLAILQNQNLLALDNLDDLEKIDFDIDPARCRTPDDLYLPDAVILPEDYGQEDIKQSTREGEAFFTGAWMQLADDKPFDLRVLKFLVTLKIKEFEQFGNSVLQSVFSPEPHPENYLARHSMNVMLLALAVGRQMGLKENPLAEVGIAGAVHDSGMARLSVDRWLIRKKFDFDDYFHVFKHPILGVDFLTLGLASRLGGLVALAVYQHHERLDGSGYPKGRKGVGVSAHARILGVCDVFEAMISDRSWRRRMAVSEAFRFVASHADILFDRTVVDALFAVLQDQNYIQADQAEQLDSAAAPVLIADTSPYNLWYICNLLRTNRIPVFAARNQEDLLQASLQQHPRVVLVDASISDRQGLDVLQTLRSREDLQKTPFIYCSNSGNKTDVVQAIQIGIQDYLKKPYTFDFVVNRLARFLK